MSAPWSWQKMKRRIRSSDSSITCQQHVVSQQLVISWLIFPSVLSIDDQRPETRFLASTLQPTDVIPIDSLTFSSCFADWLVGVPWCDQTLSLLRLLSFSRDGSVGRWPIVTNGHCSVHVKQRARCHGIFMWMWVKCGSWFFKKHPKSSADYISWSYQCHSAGIL